MMRELHLDMHQVGQLPLPRVWEIFKYFRTAPPLHLLVRDFMGYEPRDDSAPAMPPPEIAGAPINPNLPEAVRQDIEALRKKHG